MCMACGKLRVSRLSDWAAAALLERGKKCYWWLGGFAAGRNSGPRSFTLPSVVQLMALTVSEFFERKVDSLIVITLLLKSISICFSVVFILT